MLQYYVDKHDFKVYKDCPEYIPVDAEIAETIAKLNELGYETYACCAGHYNPGYDIRNNVDLKDLEECQKDKHVTILDVKENSFDYKLERTQIHIYIAFKEKYKFDSIPDGFTLEEFESTNYDGLSLNSTVDYYDEFGKLKNMFECFRELEHKHKLLESWAKNLPKNINKGKVK